MSSRGDKINLMSGYMPSNITQGGNKYMANVMFKRGLHSALFNTNGTPKITVNDGTFYLTTDTNRLYIGNQEGNTTKLVELNKSITTVPKVSDLPTEGVEIGQFYYVSGTNQTNANDAKNTHNGNILAVYMGESAGGWIQVNPDTDTDSGYDELLSPDITKTKDTTNNTITYSIDLNRQHVGSRTTQGVIAGAKTLNPISLDIVINGDDLVDIIPSTAVGITSSAYNSTNKTITINTTGNGADSSKTITVKAKNDNVTLSGAANNIEIATNDTQYTFTSNANSTAITATASGGASGTQTVTTFKAGEGLSINGATAKEIEYSHATPITANPTNASVTSGSPASVDAEDGEEITLVSGVKKDKFGHIISVDTTKVTAKNTTYTVNKVEANNSGDLTVEIKASSGGTSTKTASKSLYHTIDIYNADGTKNETKSATKYNQAKLGAFYDKAAIDDMLRSLDALTYKGTIGASPATIQALPTATDGVKNGDTYKVATAGTYGGYSTEVGDLLIATGTEDANGNITSQTLTWTLVSTGADADTTYSFSVSNNSIIASADPGGDTTVATIAGGDKLTASTSGQTITINHDKIDNLPTTALGNNTALSETNRKFKVPKFTLDNYGHVATASETELTLPDDKDTTYSISAGNSVAESGTTGSKSSIVLTAGGSGSGTSTVSIAGDAKAIDVAKSGSDIKISHKSLLTTANAAGVKYGVSSDITPAAEGTIKVPNIKVDAQGHVTEIGEQTITLPSDEDTLYTLKPVNVVKNTSSGVATVTTTFNLEDTNGGHKTTSQVGLSSSSLELTITGTGTANARINADIVWGSF